MLDLILVKKPVSKRGIDIYMQNVSYKSTDKRLKMKFVHLRTKY